jgi:hypothetical protein
MLPQNHRVSLVIMLLMIFMSNCQQLLAQNNPIDFQFSLKNNAQTSAGVYQGNGTLIKTLWSNKYYKAGRHTATWDRTDDEGNLLTDTGYYIKVLSSNASYIWEGVVGNNSDSITGSSKIRAFDRFHSLTFAGQFGYYAAGYAEGVPSCYKFDISKPNNKINILYGPHKDVDLQCDYVATDGNNVYWAGYDPFDVKLSFVFTTKTSDDKEFSHSSGTQQATAYGRTYASAIDLYTNNPNAHPSGLAVQSNGDFLFVAHKDLNQINVLNKITGTLVQALTFTAPREICVDPSGNLWVISGSNTIEKFGVNSDGTLSSALLSITGISEPLAMAVSPNGSKIFILDGAAYQQVRIFDNNSGDSISTFGSAGGYINNSSVNDYKFYFSDSATGLSKPFVAFQSDSSFWLGDIGNERVQHYNASGTFINRIMCLPHSYSTVVDRNNPNRVFNEYLEFNVDYTKALAPNNGSWTLVNNWRRGIKSNYFQSDKLRIFIQLITLSNNRTYAILDEYVNGVRKPEIVELIANANIRYTGIKLKDFANDQISTDGRLRRIVCNRELGDSGYWEEQTLKGFDQNNNPEWNTANKTTWIPEIKADDPAFISIASPVITSGDYNLVFNNHKNHTGYHLGAIKTGTKQYIWRTSKATNRTYTGPMPDDGRFDIGNNVEYPGGNVYTLDSHIFWNYHGEFWKNSQTNIWNHYHESGLMAGQFGVVSPEAEAMESEAFAKGAGNVFSSTIVKVGNDYYIYHNDESVHGGVHRWKISGLHTIDIQDIAISLSKIQKGSLVGTYYTRDNLDPIFIKYQTTDTCNTKTSGSVRWSGYLKADSGLYTIRVKVNGGFRYFLKDKLLIDTWRNSGSKSFETKAMHLNGVHPILIESKGSIDLIEWNNGKGYSRIPNERYYPGAYLEDNSINLMQGIFGGHVFKDSLYGWQAQPQKPDSTQWIIGTGIKSINKNEEDISVQFLSKDTIISLKRNLKGLKVCQNQWQISGEFNFENNAPVSRPGGAEIYLKDQNGKTLCVISHNTSKQTLGNDVISIRINGKDVFSEPGKSTQLFLNRFTAFKIVMRAQGVKFKFGDFDEVTSSYADTTANWLLPGEIELRFTGLQPRALNQLSVRRLKLEGSAKCNIIKKENKDSICEGESIELQAPKLQNYLWSEGSKTDRITVTKLGTYFLTGTDSNQCQIVSDTFNLKTISKPVPIILKSGDTLRSSSNYGNVWRLNQQVVGLQKELIAKKTGQYSLECINDFGCSGTTSIDIEQLNFQSPQYLNSRIYPNPSNGKIYIEMTELGQVSIFDCIGKCILKQNITEKNTVIEIQQSGVFLIKIEDSKGFQTHYQVNF